MENEKQTLDFCGNIRALRLHIAARVELS